MTHKQKTSVPQWRYDNLLPFIMLIGSFFIYLVRLSIVETKMDTIISNQEQDKQWRYDIVEKINQHSVDISVIQSQLKEVKK